MAYINGNKVLFSPRINIVEGGGAQPTLYAPEIALDLHTKVLTISDTKNGLFPTGYKVFKNGELLGNVQAGNTALTDFAEYDGDATIAVSATADCFNDSPEATAAWTRPKLYAPTIAIDNVTDTLTITDTNGTDVRGFEIYANGTLLATVTETTVVLSAYMELTETQSITVKALSGNEYYIDSDMSETAYWWEKTTGTEGLVYTLSSDNTRYTCNGIGAASTPDIVIASVYNGLPVVGVGGNWKGITSMYIPDSVTQIIEQGFFGCNTLKSIRIGAAVKSIGFRTFFECSALVQVTFAKNNTLETIGDLAFIRCTSLTSITIPNSVTSIGESAFEGCTKLTDVYYGGTEEQWASITIGTNNNSLINATIHYNSEV